MDLSGKNVIVTGGNVGIGRPTARELARMGASVTIIGRNEETGREAVEEIVDSTGNQKVEFKVVDLASFAQIKSFADTYKESNTRLDILVNNAGVWAPPITATEQGIEATTGINYLGHFFLTHLLKDLLMPVKGRVVMVASDAYTWTKLTLGMMDGEHEHPKLFLPVSKPNFEEYSLSNSCRILYAKEFSKRHPELICVSLHPGVIKTDLNRYFDRFWKCIGVCCSCCMLSPEDGAETSLYCATAEISAHNGMYFKNKHVEPLKKMSDERLQERLWEISMAVVESFMGMQE